MMEKRDDVLRAVEEVYAWIDGENAKVENACGACGECCDFWGYDHRLFVTTPELMHFAEAMKSEGREVKAMEDGVCPYRVDGKCGVHKVRFAGCRIFYCKGDEELQSEVCEEAMGRFKGICEEFDVEYNYVELSKGLGMLGEF